MADRFDLIVLGAGSGGLAAAKRAASHGARVAIVEGDRVGGTCVIRGCVPKKLLVYGSAYRHLLADAPSYGWDPGDVRLDASRLLANVRAEVERLNQLHIGFLEKAGVELVRGWGRFLGPHAIGVTAADGSERELEAERILIAVGGRPHRPDIPGAHLGWVSDDLFELEAYRKDVLSNVFRNDPANQISPPARDVGEKALRAIYDPVRQDMGDFIRQNGQRRDYDRWSVANRRLSEEANALQNQALKRALRTGNATPEVVNNLLFSSKPSDVAALYRNLSPRGRAAARQAIIARAATRATNAGEGAASPTRFATEIRDLGRSVGVFFNGDDLTRLQGLTRVLNATRRAGEANVFPTTGAQNYLTTLITGGVGAFGGVEALAAGASVGLAARLYESPAVRNLLLQASRTEDPQRLREIAKRIAAIEAAGVEEPRDEEPEGMYRGGLMELARKYR